jgi:hypothetical protein
VLASLRGPDAAISGIEDERAVNRAAEPERHRLHGSHVGLEQVLSRIVEVAGGPRAVRRCRALGARVGDVAAGLHIVVVGVGGLVQTAIRAKGL